ncbi:non-lysosomal glucosylceramidase [Muricauda sp. SCSIO 64092]|uniref:GH116 family glycosyl-hydrolase n=1 Tax=Allomuricauda sp. SCSIO 64092 TaxID=2908842 RepID=UPI001FF6F1D2|nr:GH116 family glycosyl-hydrolase [Muricauda sp. SCSIO 64092]UOY04893.1 non-lysosomal glucosylceramidase [Muricauda sp. SCSIO 64092]
MWQGNKDKYILSKSRRDFIKKSSIGISAMGLSAPVPFFAGPFVYAKDTHLIPEDKRLSQAWIRSLYERGVPEEFSGEQLKYIGMPVGGIACGQLYLGGDGRLWLWHIFKMEYGREKNHGNQLDAMTLGGHYAYPDKVFDREKRSVDHGIALRVKHNGKTKIVKLNNNDFKHVSFRGEYPIGKVKYHDDAIPVEIKLEAFSPFVPTSLEKSALPTTVMSYKLKNTSGESMAIDMAGWLENAVCPFSNNNHLGVRRNTVIPSGGRLTLHSTAEGLEAKKEAKSTKQDVVFEDFESGSYKKWQTKGIAFGKSPIKEDSKGFLEKDYKGSYYVSSYNIRALDGRPNASTYQWGREAMADDFTGILTSKEFVVTHNYITFLIGGGYHPKDTVINLLIDGKIVRSETGHNSTHLRETYFDVRDFVGKKGQLQIVDNHQGVWGNITVDHIVFTDNVPKDYKITNQHGYGSMSWSIYNPTQKAKAIPHFNNENLQTLFNILDNTPTGEALTVTKPMAEKQVGIISDYVDLGPGEEKEVIFLLTWYFPHLNQQERERGAILGLKDIKYLKRHYYQWFRSANQVADYVCENFDELVGKTRLWNETWYGSTLPHWLLDRSMIPLDCMATNTVLWFDNGRIWGWEGVECCEGTCQHVWQYAQGMARIFPEAERNIREITDMDPRTGYREEDGGFAYRAESNRSVAHDGHCGTIMRMYREHKTSTDHQFLKRNYAQIKRTVQFIINEDKDKNGLLEGGQANTLDAKWYGPMGWISSLYLGALAAGKAMAEEIGDFSFANICDEILRKGRKNIVEKLFNGEYFIHKHDRQKYPDVISSNNGCHIDQVLGQSLAGQIGIRDRVIPEEETKLALESIWKYNFAPNAFNYQKRHKAIKGVRIYATEGEAGTIMTTWPKDDGDTWAVPGMVDRPDSSIRWQGPGGYFDECMNGFEYQVAFHMIQEGMTEKGLAIARAVHDRYHANTRNPYNEIECSDHYSRSMASYGVFLAICGYDYHGPKGFLTLDPKLTPNNFKAPFTVAKGWGTFIQHQKDGIQKNILQLKYGELNLNQFSVVLPKDANAKLVSLMINGKEVNAQGAQKENGKFQWELEEQMKSGDTLKSIIHY